jgi:hypothetical protein
MSTALARPVQKFKPTTGPAIGFVGLAVCVLVVGVVATSERSAVGAQVALGAVLLAVVIWLVLLRPRAAAYDDTLVLRGMLSDTTLPLAGIDAAVVRHVLVVWIGDDRYTCAGIARSTRSMMRRRSSAMTSTLGLHQTDPRAGAAGDAGDIGTSGDYATFVETRIEDLARSARRDGRDAPPVRRTWARLEIAALAASALAFLLSLVLL